MIAIDTSALMAIVLNEPVAEQCRAAVRAANLILISSATLAEAMIVALRKDVSASMQDLLDELSLEVMPVTEDSARRAAEAYRRWGKGRHPARLNFGDCFSYELATGQGCPLLFVGQDFALTDMEPATSAG